MALRKNHKCCLITHNLTPKLNTSFGLTLVELCSVHSMRMHKDRNALHFHSHAALGNCWFVFAGYALKLCSWPDEEQRSYTEYLLFSLYHTLAVYCTAVLFENLIFLLCNQQRWPSDVKCLAKARMCCLVKHVVTSCGVVMDGCEVMVNLG